MILLLNAFDKIQRILAEEFTQTIPTKDIILSLVVAILAAIIINYIYKKTFTGVSYAKSFALSIILLTMVTSLVIRTINSNLALSLGMVGALSIVRFRTAVKDPVDTIFMFWAITVGIMSGAGLYLTTILATVILGVLYSLSYMLIFKPVEKYLLVIKVDKKASKKITDKMSGRNKCILKTESIKDEIVEFTYELGSKEIADEILSWKNDENDNKDIKSINLVNVN